MPRVNPAVKNEIINRTDAVAVAGEYVRLQKIGNLWKGCCPFHSEKTPSFTVNPDKKLYYCFGCHKGGDMINFVMEMDKLNFFEALELLAKKAGVPLLFDNGGDDGEAAQAAKRKEELAELYRRVTITFHHFLLEKAEGAAALSYIRDRGLSAETIEQFRLGFAPADGRWLAGFLRKKGYSPEFLAQSGLFSKKKPEAAFFRNRLMFPIADRTGKTVAFGGRILPPEEGPKYLNSAESELFHKGETLFAIDRAIPAIRAAKEVFICEGYMDVIALHQAGAANAAAPLGTAFTSEQARLLGRWAARVNLLFDTDTAGQNAAAKAIITCRGQNLECRVVTMRDEEAAGEGAPPLKDPADILRERGPQALERVLKNSVMDIDFLLTRSKALSQLSGYEGKKEAIRRLFPFLETIESDISRDEYVKRIALDFEADHDDIRRDFAALRGKGEGAALAPNGHEARAQAEEKPENRLIQMNDELYLLIAVFVHCDAKPELFSKLRAALPIEEFTCADAKELYLTFEEALRGGSFNTESVLSALKDKALWQYLIAKSATDEFKLQPEELLADGIRRIKVKRLKQKARELGVRLRIAKSTGEDMEDLLAEKMFIDETVQDLERPRGGVPA